MQGRRPPLSRLCVASRLADIIPSEVRLSPPSLFLPDNVVNNIFVQVGEHPSKCPRICQLNQFLSLEAVCSLDDAMMLSPLYSLGLRSLSAGLTSGSIFCA